MTIAALLITLIVFCALIWAAYAIVNAFSIPDPIRTIILVVVVLVALTILLDRVGILGGGGLTRLC